MNDIVISKRLKTIAGFVPNGSKVADIGSDHALLPSYLVDKGVSPYVIAGEVNEGPYQAASKQVNDFNLGQQISVRKGNGLQVIEEHEIDVITIAGMGGALIVEILNEGLVKLKHVKRLILQPNVGEEAVREWLDQHHWQIVDEEILEENDKIYEIIVSEPKNFMDVTDINKENGLQKEESFKLGPVLWKKRSPLLLKKWQKEKEKLLYVIGQLQKAKNDQEFKRDMMIKEMEWIEKVIKCLQTDKPLSKF